MKASYRLRIPIVALLGVLLVALLIRGRLSPLARAADPPGSAAVLTTPTLPPTMTPAPTMTPGQCPVATAEPLWVESLISPTTLLTQTIAVHAGIAMTVTVSSEAGVVTGTAPLVGQRWTIPIQLLPNTTHHLTVESWIPRTVTFGCVYGGYTLRTTTDVNGAPLTIVQTEVAPTTPTITPMPTVTPGPCPVATPEPLRVEPVVSPTSLLTQTITIYAGGALTVTVSSESGVFTQTVGSTWPARIMIDLLPQTAHHLTVRSQIPRRVVNGCVYGGYSLQTTRDRDGNLLTIVQDGAATPTAIGPTPTLPATQNQRELYLPLLRR